MTSTLTPIQREHWNDSKQSSALSSLVVLLCLGNLSVAVRLVAQLRTHRHLFVEDYLIIFAAACSDVVIALLLVAVHYGLGLHVWRVMGTDPQPPANLVSMFKYIWITAILNGPCFLSIKLSLLFFYRRIFLANQAKLRIFWWVNLIYAILWFFGSTFSFIFQCVPVQYYWNRTYLKFPNAPSNIHGQCHASENWQIALPIAFSVISDFALLGLPVFTLLGLNMSKKHKTALIAIFSLGLLACFLELARVIVILAGTDVSTDPSYNTVAFLILSSAGEATAIICACLPLIAAQVRHIFQEFGVYWHTRSDRKEKTSRLTRLTNPPIMLASRRKSEDHNRDQARDGEYGSRETLRTGTRTIIDASADRYIGVEDELEGGIRVKTDLECIGGMKF